MPCPSCGRGFHSECENGCNNCHHDMVPLVDSLSGHRGAPVKSASAVTDPYSTGRKRAAIQYPLFTSNPCEWRGMKNCGGGLRPIIGCMNGKQTDRHHGPVKNPLRNEPGNVHRICKKCHNRWHVENDPDYNEMVFDETNHEPEIATELDLLANEAQWKMRK